MRIDIARSGLCGGGRSKLLRAIIVGNGSILATGDRACQLHELYAPSIAPGHQLLRRPARLGISEEGSIRWIGSEAEARVVSSPRLPIAQVSLALPQAELEIWIEIHADAQRDVVIRRVQITNRADRPRDLRLFFHHDFRLAHGEARESAFRDGSSGALIHQAGRRLLAINMEGPEGRGTALWRVLARAVDEAPGAEVLPRGGALDGPAQAHGRVDSLVGTPLPLEAGASGLVSVRVFPASSLREARSLDDEVQSATVGGTLSRTRAHWNLWLRAAPSDLPDLPEDVGELFEQSLVVLRLHQAPGGAFLSRIEEDPEPPLARTPTPAALPRVCVHRVAAVVAEALGRAGFPGGARRYLEFVTRSTAESGGFAPVVDETGAPIGGPPDPAALALVVWAIGRHFERERDVEFLAPIYRGVAAPATDALPASIDPALDLPASLDLWEERAGFHAWTASVVRAGLQAGARLAASFGDSERALAADAAADRIGRALIRHLVHPDQGRFLRSVTTEGRNLRHEPTLDASMLWLSLLDELEPEDSRVRATVDAVKRILWVRTGVGGIARYEHDPAASVGADLMEVPGSPSPVATLWLAEHAIRTARRAQDLDAARTLLLWCAARAQGLGGLPERLHPYGGACAGLLPSVHAHAWLVLAVLDYIERLQALRRCERCGAPAQAGQSSRLSGVPALLPGLVAHA